MARGSKPGERRGGRKPGVPNKATRDLKALAQKYAPEALKKLASIMRNSDSDAAKVAAIKEIFDRGYGKALQTVGGENGGPLKVIIQSDDAKVL